MLMSHYSYKYALIALSLAAGLVGATLLCKFALSTAQGPVLALFSPQPGQNEVMATVQQISQEGSCVAQALEEQLNQEHERLVINLHNAFPTLDWQKVVQKFNKCVIEDKDHLLVPKPQLTPQAGEHTVVTLAKKLLVEYGIDPNHVQVYTISEPESLTNAAAEQAFYKNGVLSRISINLPRLSQRSADVQEAILRHEIRHLIYHDPLELSFIEDLFEENGITAQQYMRHPDYIALNKHKEYRADLTAACHGVDTAHAFKKNFEYNIQQNPHLQDDPTYWVTHPSNKQRHAAMNQLVGYLNAENQLQLA